MLYYLNKIMLQDLRILKVNKRKKEFSSFTLKDLFRIQTIHNILNFRPKKKNIYIDMFRSKIYPYKLEKQYILHGFIFPLTVITSPGLNLAIITFCLIITTLLIYVFTTPFDKIAVSIATKFSALTYAYFSVHIYVMNKKPLHDFVDCKIKYLEFYHYINVHPVVLFEKTFASIAILFCVFFLYGISTRIISRDTIEYPLSILFFIFFASILFIATDVITIFLLIEALAFLGYIMVSLKSGNFFSNTIGIRYLLLSAIPGGLFLLGLLELHVVTGETYMDFIRTVIANIDRKGPTLVSHTWNIAGPDNIYSLVSKDFFLGRLAEFAGTTARTNVPIFQIKSLLATNIDLISGSLIKKVDGEVVPVIIAEFGKEKAKYMGLIDINDFAKIFSNIFKVLKYVENGKDVVEFVDVSKPLHFPYFLGPLYTFTFEDMINAYIISSERYPEVQHLFDAVLPANFGTKIRLAQMNLPYIGLINNPMNSELFYEFTNNSGENVRHPKLFYAMLQQTLPAIMTYLNELILRDALLEGRPGFDLYQQMMVELYDKNSLFKEIFLDHNDDFLVRKEIEKMLIFPKCFDSVCAMVNIENSNNIALEIFSKVKIVRPENITYDPKYDMETFKRRLPKELPPKYEELFGDRDKIEAEKFLAKKKSGLYICISRETKRTRVL